MSVENIPDDRLKTYYENIWQQVEADRAHNYHFTSGPVVREYADKLRDAALADAIDGAPKQVRLPWLRVRMPRFQHTPAEKEALLTYLIGHDRIPDPDPPHPNSVLNTAPDTAEEAIVAKAGRTLIGAQGFSCVACHRLGNFEPGCSDRFGTGIGSNTQPNPQVGKMKTVVGKLRSRGVTS